MDKNLFLIIIGLFVCLGFVSSMDENYTGMEVDTLATVPATLKWAQVEINTTSFNFGIINLSSTISDEKEIRIQYKIRNRGNVNIEVHPKLKTDDEKNIFQNLWFARTTSETKKRIGNYTILMNQTSEFENWATKHNQYIWLNLKNYISENGQVPFDIVDHKKTVIFEVMPSYVAE